MSAVEENYCDLCDITYSTPAELKEHKWSLIHHVKIEQKTKNAEHPCTVCYMSCSSLPEYTKHLNSEKHKNAVRTEKRVNQQKLAKRSAKPQAVAADTTSDLRFKASKNSSSKKKFCDKSKVLGWSSSSVNSVSSDQPSSSNRQASVGTQQKQSNKPAQQRTPHQPAQQRSSQQRPAHQPTQQRTPQQLAQQRLPHEPGQQRLPHQPEQQRPPHQPTQQRPPHQPTVGDESSEYRHGFDSRFDWVDAYKYGNSGGQQRRQYPEVWNREPYQDAPFGYNNSWQQNMNNSRTIWPNWTTFDPYEGNYSEPPFCKPRFHARFHGQSRGLLRTPESAHNGNPRFPGKHNNQSFLQQQNELNFDNYPDQRRHIMDVHISPAQESGNNTHLHTNTEQEIPTSSDAKCFRNTRDSMRPYPKQSPNYERSARSRTAGNLKRNESPYSSRSNSPSLDFLPVTPMDIDKDEETRIDDNNLGSGTNIPAELVNSNKKKLAQSILHKSMDNVSYKSLEKEDRTSIENVAPTTYNISRKSIHSVGQRSTETIDHKATNKVDSKSTDGIGHKSKNGVDRTSRSNISCTGTDNSSRRTKTIPKAVPKVSDKVLGKTRKTSKSVVNVGIRSDILDQAESLVKGIREKRELDIIERVNTIDKRLKEIRNESTTSQMKMTDDSNSSTGPNVVKNPLSIVSQNTPGSTTGVASDRESEQKSENTNEHKVQQRLHVAQRFSELYSKDNLAVMVNSPRSRRQRQQVSEMVRIYSKSQAAKRSIPQLNLCGIYDDAQNLSQSIITLEELPSELQEQIAALLQITSDDEQGEDYPSNVQLNNIEDMLTSSAGNSLSISTANKLSEDAIKSQTDHKVTTGKKGADIGTESIEKACDPSGDSILPQADKLSSTALCPDPDTSSSVTVQADHHQPSSASSDADLITMFSPLKDDASDLCVLSVSDYLAARMKFDPHSHDAGAKSKTRLAGSDTGAANIVMIMDDDDDEKEEEITGDLQFKVPVSRSSQPRSLSTSISSLTQIKDNVAVRALNPHKVFSNDVVRARHREESSVVSLPDSSLPIAQCVNTSIPKPCTTTSKSYTTISKPSTTIAEPCSTIAEQQTTLKNSVIHIEASNTVTSSSAAAASSPSPLVLHQHFSTPELSNTMQISKQNRAAASAAAYSLPETSQSGESLSLQTTDCVVGEVLPSGSSQHEQYQTSVLSGPSVQLPMKKSECFKAILDLSLREEELRIELSDVNEKLNSLQTLLQQYVFRKQQIINEEEEIRAKRISLLQDAVSRERTDTTSVMDYLFSPHSHSSNISSNSSASQAASISQNTDSGDSLLQGQNGERLSLSSGTKITSDVGNIQGEQQSASIMPALNTMQPPSHMFSPGQMRLGSSLLPSPSQQQTLYSSAMSSRTVSLGADYQAHVPHISSPRSDTSLTASQTNSSAIPMSAVQIVTKLEPIDVDDASDASENDVPKNVSRTKQMYIEPILQTSTATTTVQTLSSHSSNSLNRPIVNPAPSCSNLNTEYAHVQNQNSDRLAKSVDIHDSSYSLSDTAKTLFNAINERITNAIENSDGRESCLVPETNLASDKSFSVDSCSRSHDSLGHERKSVSAHLTAVLHQSDLPHLALSEPEDGFLSPSRRPPMRSVLECSKVHEASPSKLCIRKSPEELQEMDVKEWKDLIQQQPERHVRTDLLLTMKKEILDIDNEESYSYSRSKAATSDVLEPISPDIISSLDSCLNDINKQIDQHDRLGEDSLNPCNNEKVRDLLMEEEDDSNSLPAVDNSNVVPVVGDVTDQVTRARTTEVCNEQQRLVGDDVTSLQPKEDGESASVNNDGNTLFRVPDRPMITNNASSPERISPSKKKLRTKKQRDRLAAKTYGRLVDSSSDNNIQEACHSPTQTKPNGKKKARKLSPSSDKGVPSDNVCDSSTSNTMNTRQKSKKKKEKAEKGRPQRKKPVSDHSLLQAPTSSMCEVVTATESSDLPDITAPRRGQSKRKKGTDKTRSKRSSSKLNTTLTDTDMEDPNPSPDTSTSSFIEAQPVSLFIGPTRTVSCVQEHEDYVYVCYGGAGAEKFDPRTCRSLQKFKSGEHKTHCMVVVGVDDESLLCLGGISKILLIFKAQTGQRLSSHVYGASIQCLHYNWEQMFVGMTNGAVLVFDPKRGKTICAFRCSQQSISCIASATEGSRKLICVASHDSSISVCDATTGLLMRTLDSHTKVPLSMQANGDQLYSGGTDKVLMVHNIHNGDLEWMYTDCRGVITSVIPVVMDSHNILLTASYDKLIRCYNQQTHKLMFVLYGVEKSVITTMTYSNNKVYTGNKEGEVEAMTLQLNQLWTCQCSTCSYVFGLQEHLLYHVCSDHILPNSKMTRCPWSNCNEWLMMGSSLERANEHMAGHVKSSFQPLS